MVMTAFIAVGILWWKYSDHTKAGAVQWIDVEKPETYMPEMMSLQGSSSSSGKTVERDNKFKQYIVSWFKDKKSVETIGENYMDIEYHNSVVKIKIPSSLESYEGEEYYEIDLKTMELGDCGKS